MGRGTERACAVDRFARTGSVWDVKSLWCADTGPGGGPEARRPARAAGKVYRYAARFAWMRHYSFEQTIHSELVGIAFLCLHWRYQMVVFSSALRQYVKIDLMHLLIFLILHANE